jgi:NAD(P)-dependent dehydrogenase (short-subunit alcohol dehydrogenase family)
MATTPKTVIVTGASQGIGAAIANLFIDLGYNVVANSRNVSAKNELQRSDNLALVDGDISHVATDHPRRWSARIYALLIALAALATIAVAARQLYVQHLPPGAIPSCGAPLSAMLKFMPPAVLIRRVLSGSGECASSTGPSSASPCRRGC